MNNNHDPQKTKEEARAAALRANLKRRKEQQRKSQNDPDTAT